MRLKLGIEQGTDAVVEALRKMSQKTETKEEIASVATNPRDPERGQPDRDVMDKVGKDGVITVEETKSLQFETEYVEGMHFDRTSRPTSSPSRTHGDGHRRTLILVYERKFRRPGYRPPAREARPDWQA